MNNQILDRNLYLIYQDGLLNIKIAKLIMEYFSDMKIEIPSIWELTIVNAFSQSILNLCTLFSKDSDEQYIRKILKVEHENHSQVHSDEELEKYRSMFYNIEWVDTFISQIYQSKLQETWSFLQEIKMDLRHKYSTEIHKKLRKIFEEFKVGDFRNTYVAHKNNERDHGTVWKCPSDNDIRIILFLYEELFLLVWLESKYTHTIPIWHQVIYTSLYDTLNQLYITRK